MEDTSLELVWTCATCQAHDICVFDIYWCFYCENGNKKEINSLVHDMADVYTECWN